MDQIFTELKYSNKSLNVLLKMSANNSILFLKKASENLLMHHKFFYEGDHLSELDKLMLETLGISYQI